MDHTTIEEENVVERYVAGKLEPEDVARFEEHYLDCAACIDAVEDAERLHRGLGRIAAQETVEALAARRIALLAWSRSRWAPLAMAALVVLALLPAGWQYRRSSVLSRQLEEERRPQVNTPVVSLVPFRDSGFGESPVQELSLAAEPEWIVLSLEPGGPGFPLYRATLLDAGGEVVWEVEGLEPNDLGALSVAVHSSWLAPGEYDLALEGLAEGGATSVPMVRFPLRVTGPSNRSSYMWPERK